MTLLIRVCLDLLILIQEINCLTCTFSVITLNKSCGLVHGEDTWYTEGTLKKDKDKHYYAPKVEIKDQQGNIQCTLGLEFNCPPASIPTTGNACYCTSQKDSSYKLLFRQVANADYNEEFLKARCMVEYVSGRFPGRMGNKISTTKIVKEEDIGPLPTVYHVSKATYEAYWRAPGDLMKSHVEKAPLKTSQNLTVRQGANVDITFCVSNLLSPYRFNINHEPVATTNHCTAKHFEWSALNEPVIFSYTEIQRCQRTEEFRLYIVDQSGKSPPPHNNVSNPKGNSPKGSSPKSDGNSAEPAAKISENSQSSNMAVIIPLIIAIVVVVLVITGMVLYAWRENQQNKEPAVSPSSSQPRSPDPEPTSPAENSDDSLENEGTGDIICICCILDKNT